MPKTGQILCFTDTNLLKLAIWNYTSLYIIFDERAIITLVKGRAGSMEEEQGKKMLA